MTHLHNSSRDEAEVWLSSRGAAQGHAVDGPHIVAMDQRETQSQEAYYLFFVGSLGMALNILVITMIFIRRNLRRMTSAFLVHSGFLNLLKAGFCIPFGLNLLSEADEKSPPQNCRLQGSIFIVLVTTSAVNMVAMICTEAYTFGEINVGGNSHGTSCCIMFGLLVVYITSVILHLGPTLIGGAIKYNPHIGSCAFELGNITGYVANVMWIVIITLSFVGVGHFLSKLYKEIQLNKPNRVSMLVRHSITITEEMARKPSACTVQEMTQEAMHRAKIFVITAIAFALCWYPLFLLILIDMHFRVSPKVYQAFSFIAWTEALVEPIILICFDRNLNLLARFMYCDRDQFTAAQIAFLMAQHRQQQQQLHHHHHHLHHHHEDDDQVDASRQSSIDADDAFHCGAAHALGECSGCSTSGGEPHHPTDPGLPNSIVPCRHCCPTPPPLGETTPLRSHHHHHHRPPSPQATLAQRRLASVHQRSRTSRFPRFPAAHNPGRGRRHGDELCPFPNRDRAYSTKTKRLCQQAGRHTMLNRQSFMSLGIDSIPRDHITVLYLKIYISTLYDFMDPSIDAKGLGPGIRIYLSNL